MAFLRFTRDKRGYEHFYLVQPTANRRGKARSRVLYWFRTPPNVRVGREPFDESVRRALEAKNPDVQFDWRKIVETPIPSVDAERWRERRRAERAEKAARRGAPDEGQRSVRDESADVDEGAAAEEALDTTGGAGGTPEPEALEGLEAEREGPSEMSDSLEPARIADAPTDSVGRDPAASPENLAGVRTHDTRKRRRRRRGRRGRHDVHASQPGVAHASDSGPIPPAQPEEE